LGASITPFRFSPYEFFPFQLKCGIYLPLFR
jgi:hypothetical protein